MTSAIPADFPQVGRTALEAIRKVHAPTYVKVLEFIGITWGDLGGIDKITAVWKNEATRAGESIERLNRSFSKLTNESAQAYWQGNAREEYVNWRADFKTNTLDKYHQNMWNIKAQLDDVRGNILSIRGHVIAMAIEAGGMAIGIATAATVAGSAEGIIALVAFVGTFLDFQFRVLGDLEGKGRNLENIRDRDKVDRGGGVVSLPFKTDVIGDWDNWENRQG